MPCVQGLVPEGCGWGSEGQQQRPRPTAGCVREAGLPTPSEGPALGPSEPPRAGGLRAEVTLGLWGPRGEADTRGGGREHEGVVGNCLILWLQVSQAAVESPQSTFGLYRTPNFRESLEPLDGWTRV